MENVSIYRSGIHPLYASRNVDSPFIITLKKPYFPLFCIDHRNELPFVPPLIKHRYRLNKNSYEELNDYIKQGNFLVEARTKSRHYLGGWLTIFELKEDRIIPRLVTVAPNHLISYPTDESTVHYINSIKKYMEVWYNSDTPRDNPYLSKWLEENIFDLLTMNQIPVIDKPESEFWEKVLVKYENPEFDDHSELIGFGNRIYRNHIAHQQS